jgi:hypothetical protein
MADRVILTIGTKKGVFVADAAKPRRSFALRGPFGPGVPVYSTLIDARGTPRLYASSCNPFFGMKVLRSTDLGKSFTETKSAPAFPKEDGRALANIWALEAGGGKRRVVESARAWAAEEAELLHRPARRDGHRPAQGTCTLLRHDDRSTVDREEGGEQWDCLFDSLPPIHNIKVAVV